MEGAREENCVSLASGNTAFSRAHPRTPRHVFPLNEMCSLRPLQQPCLPKPVVSAVLLGSRSAYRPHRGTSFSSSNLGSLHGRGSHEWIWKIRF